MSSRLDSTGPTTAELSRVPYLPGLDGLRALAVVGVMVYHANHTWLRGGFLGVEVFFVISGYLITLLLMGEFERTGAVRLSQFWVRRFRRLLPALFVMLVLMLVYITAFYPAVREQTRGDFLGGALYVSNWYQLFVGQGYASAEAFVPLRHLWSLAVEEQFYLLWPLVMVVLLHRSRRGLPGVGARLIGVSLAITVLMAVLFPTGFVPLSCTAENSNGYWQVFGRCISVTDTLYLSSVTRAGGLMLGAGFAMLWRPMAILRGPLRHKGRQLDVLALFGLAVLALLMWSMYLLEEGRYNAWLFRGGFFLTGIATLAVIAAATHRHALTGDLLGNPVFRWIGTRSYGLYLYHWPVYQIIRKQAQIGLSFGQLLLAMAITVPITEFSYQFVETPIRQGRAGELLAAVWRDTRTKVATVTVVFVVLLAAFSMYNAEPQCVGQVACSLAANTTVPDGSTGPDGSTVPGDSSLTSSTVPKVPQKYVAIGESVMVGAVEPLAAAGVLVDAEQNRGAQGVVDAIRKLVDLGDIGAGTVVVVQLGTNGPIDATGYDSVVAAVPPEAARIVFLTVRSDKYWTEPNSELVRALPSRYPNVTVIDWAVQSQQVELCKDGTHISCGTYARDFYANLILTDLGLPTIVLPSTTTSEPTATT